MIRHGMYDAGFIAVASTATDVMDWWAECCLHAPKGKILEGVRGDEATLNLMPVYFKDVHILQHKGCNVGEWNQNECIRVLQPDGEILINGTEPIIFIHFNSTMDHNTDIMLLGHLKKYLLTLKNNDPSHTIYERIKIIRNNYGNQHKLPNWYKLLKKKILQILSACFHHKNINNTAILSHPGTPKQQLGLRLRKNRGVIVSDLPFKEWQPDTEAKMLQNMQELYFSQGIDAINGFTEDLMEHKKSNLPSMHWENIRSLLSWKMILIMLPDNSLCWPLLAEAIGKKWKTIALFANPFHFALRMHTFENQAWKAKALAEVDDFLNKRPILHNLVHEHESAISRWILKWWIDLTRLKKRADEGAHIHIIHEDDLYHAQDETLTGVCEKLGLPYDPTISIQQHHNYIYSVEPSQKNKAGQWRRYLSDKEYQTGAELLEQLEITETGSSVRHHD
jgi:hypothetical protein